MGDFFIILYEFFFAGIIKSKLNKSKNSVSLIAFIASSLLSFISFMDDIQS